MVVLLRDLPPEYSSTERIIKRNALTSVRLQKLIFSKPVSNTYGMYIRIQRTKELKDLICRSSY